MANVHRRAVLMTGGLALAYPALARAHPLLGEARPAPARGCVGSAPAHRPSVAPQAGEATYPTDGTLPLFPSTDRELMSAVVLYSHTDIDRVRELVTARPHLARAARDWGFGDWESALGAASHMGRRDIAELLLSHGARPDIFSAAMLGQLEAVRGFVAATPGIQGVPGPHGISLLAHARAGGDEAAAVVEYLEAIGGADTRAEMVDMDEAARARFLGTYDFGDGEADALLVEENRGALSLKRVGHPFGRRLFPVADNAFYPSGSPTVRIVFEGAEGTTTTVRIIDHEEIVAATRRAG